MTAPTGTSENGYIAEKLNEVADLLQQQNASSFRINAFRKAADYVSQVDFSLREIHASAGLKGLEDLPTIGPSIAQAIAELLDTGSLSMLDRLRGSLDPEKLFQTVPTIGPHIAHLLHNELHLETLEALEAAAVDGRLREVKGIGPRRVRSIQHALAEMLAHRRPRGGNAPGVTPPIETLLEVDRTYRTQAAKGRLATISPRRFNPKGDIRIPILHAEVGAWRFTALFSNSQNAHRFGRTRDWVLIFFERDGQAEGQCTVVTAHNGILAGKRVVRGHEAACLGYYEEKPERELSLAEDART